MSKRVALVSAVLVAALVLAVVGATAALRLIGSGTIGPGGRPLSEADVRRSFARAAGGRASQPSPVAIPTQGRERTPHTSPSPGRTPAARSGTFTGSAGSVLASCASGQVKLTGWIPASGFGTDGYVQGPAASAWVKFKSDGTELTVTATCVNGKPHFVTSSDDKGGGRGGDGGGGGTSGGSGH